MTYFEQGRGSARVEPCRYDGSKLWLRGPRRDLDYPFIACLGGTETFGRFIGVPYPDLLEDRLGTTCVNFGWPNAGLDVFFNDKALVDCASRAELVVLQVPNAVNMSNMYYRVHPRRNDRLIEVTEALKALFPEVDFTRFNFTRHLLIYLRQNWPDRFAYVQKELTAVWVSGMAWLLAKIETPVVLLWMSARRPEDQNDLPS